MPGGGGILTARHPGQGEGRSCPGFFPHPLPFLLPKGDRCYRGHDPAPNELEYLMGSWTRELMRNQRGFTLTELIIVVAVIAILAAISMALNQNLLSRSKATADYATIGALNSASAIYMGGDGNGSFPVWATLITLVTPAPVWKCITHSASDYNQTTGMVTPQAGLANVTCSQ